MTLAKKNNEHIPVDVLARLLAEELAAIEGDVGSRVVLESLGKLKSGADNTTMALVRSATGQPKAVISCSRPAAPDLIKRGVEEAEAIRGLIGEPLGAAIIKPIASGYVDGRSYVILPWYRELAGWKPFWLMQRLALRRPLLRWLSHSTAVAASTHGSSEKTSQTYKTMLTHLAQQSFIDGEIGTALEKAVRRLEGGTWQPVHTFDHNDLWLGNVLLTAHTGHVGKQSSPFVLIDWAGANQYGYGIYDLIRLARALKLSPASLRRELITHSKALQCEPQDTRGHLLAAFGRLHQHLECFPEERFVETLRACLGTMERALPASNCEVGWRGR